MAAGAEGEREHGAQRVEAGYRLLQTLVGIRLRSVSDPECRRHLTWLSDLIAALGLMNRRGSVDGPVDFAAYLKDAAVFWRRTCDARGVRINIRAADQALHESHALPLAIILHELMSNAVRHAFAENAKGGSIAVAYSRASDGVSLVVRDSGVGAGAIKAGDGLSLVQGLVEHLGGAVSIETAPGAGVGVRVRLPIEGRLPH